MKIRLRVTFVFALAFFAIRSESAASKLDEKLAPEIARIVKWAANPEVIKAVATQNQGLASGYTAMSQEKWAALHAADPLVTALMRNSAAKFLRGARTSVVSEAFLNDAWGYKVAFIQKPTNWSHQTLPKHTVPMNGEIWRGPIEVDASSGTKQIQFSVPVLDQGRPIGSLIVGLSIFEIAQD
jgi:hypothetical protein